MSDYITDRDGKRITAKHVEQLIRTLKVIRTWAAFQIEHCVDYPDDMLGEIVKAADETLGEL